MMRSSFTFLALVASSVAWTVPVEYVEERHVVEVNKRQADIPQLLQLASLAGIGPLPTDDPAVLLQLGPLANSLASALPTPSVLSVLLTAAPSGFVSSIVNDQSYANSFESDFSAGKSPSWFNGLPTDVRSYLHTYSGFGGLATAAGAIKGATSSAGGEARGASETTGSAASASSGVSGASATNGSSMTMDSTASAASMSSASAANGASSVATTEGNTASLAAAAGTASSSVAQGRAAQPTGALAAGLAGVVGVLGAAFML